VKILLLSAYAAQSHVFWHESLAQMFADWEWYIHTLPPRHFSWRIRGNPLYWSLAEREQLEGDYDLLIVTSMVDLATLRGLVPRLADLPTVLYFHENQFCYPQNKPKHSLLEAQMVSLYSSLVADAIVFNSNYNQNSFLDGCGTLLGGMPDRVPKGIIPMLQGKSRVLSVPLNEVVPAFQEGVAAEGSGSWSHGGAAFSERPLRLLWVGRFEYDKGGDNLLLILQLLEEQAISYELAVVGQQFRNSPSAFRSIEEEFQHRLVQFGYLDSRADYQTVLAGADMVLSTALHEFQGLAVLEAVAAGCVPVVPGRLVYPEIFSPSNNYPSYPPDRRREAAGAAALIVELSRQLELGSVEAPDVSSFTRVILKPQYRALFESLAGAGERS
jgi:glycosyltransferase involved in cell wall biosynthesis